MKRLITACHWAALVLLLSAPLDAAGPAGSLTPEFFPQASPFGFMPLSTSGLQSLPCQAGCDDEAILLPGLDFVHLGQRYTEMVMSTNGFLVAGPDLAAADTPVNQNLPSAVPPNNVIAPLWADLNVGPIPPAPGAPASVPEGVNRWFYAAANVSGRDYHIFEWADAFVVASPGDVVSFQVVIEQGTSDLWLIYAGLPALPPAVTVGAEDPTGTLGSSFYFDGLGTPPAVGTDLKLKLRANIGFDAFPAGTVIDRQHPAVIFDTVPGSEVQAVAVPFGSSPPNILCTVATAGPACVDPLFVSFSGPVDDLTFHAIGLKGGGSAQVDVYQGDILTATVNVPGLGDGQTPVLVDLTIYAGVTGIDIRNISDPAGVGWDDFNFVIDPSSLGAVFADGFESGDASSWTIIVG